MTSGMTACPLNTSPTSRPCAARSRGRLAREAPMEQVHAGDALVGAWRLVSWENQADDGQVTHPIGGRRPGLPALHRRWPLLRDHLAAGSGRVRRRRPAQRDHRGAGPGRGGFVAYAGRYSFHGDRVIHHVELSLFPNWGRERPGAAVELAEDRLTLSASPLLLAGRQQVPRLVWERVDPWPATG